MSVRRTRWSEAPFGPAAPSDPAAAHVFDLLTGRATPCTVEELRDEGISAPAQAIYELQVAGYEIDRVTVRDQRERSATGYLLRLPADESAPIERHARTRDTAAARSRRRGRGEPSAGRTSRRGRRQAA